MVKYDYRLLREGNNVVLPLQEIRATLSGMDSTKRCPIGGDHECIDGYAFAPGRKPATEAYQRPGGCAGGERIQAGGAMMNEKYSVIYADPPWSYRHCASNSRRIENQYDTMSLDDIKLLPVPSEDNAVLYLWATAPKLQEALGVMLAWGFDYRTCMVWDKEIIGMGYWFRGQHELLLVGVKGAFSPPGQSLRVSSVLRHRRSRHSQKPNVIRDWIDAWYPSFSKIELFARAKAMGWDTWGNEVGNDIVMAPSSDKAFNI